MLQNWISQNMFLYGMAAAGVLGFLCTLAANHFYNRVIGDLKRPDQPKTKWMGQTLSLYREKSRGKMLPNPDVFVRNQLNEGRVLGLSLSRWRRGAGYLGFLCFAGTCAAVYRMLPVSPAGDCPVSACGSGNGDFSWACHAEPVFRIFRKRRADPGRAFGLYGKPCQCCADPARTGAGR